MKPEILSVPNDYNFDPRSENMRLDNDFFGKRRETSNAHLSVE